VIHRQQCRSSQSFRCWTIFGCLFALSCVFLGCSKPEGVAATEVSVQAEKAQRHSLTEYVFGNTTLSPHDQAAIASKISAPVRKFLVQRGDRVKAGQLLAVLENADLAAAVRDSNGSLKQADANYATTTKAGVVEDLQKAQLDVAQAKANLEVQQSVFDARQKLLEEGAIPRRDFETARAGLVQAKATADIANQHLSSLQSVSQRAAIDTAEGMRSSAQGKYEAAQAGLSYSEIRSPIDGVVTERPLFAGEMANAGQTIITVMNISSLIAKVHISQEQARSLKLGADALLTVSGETEPFHGQVMLVSPALDPGSTTLEVWVKVPNKSAALRAGTSVKVSLAARTVADAITIPNEALIATKAGLPAVMVIGSDGIAHQKEVTTGITDGHDTQILKGIQPGEEVVTKGAYGMDDGTKVKVGAAGDDDEKPAAGKAGDGK
jgi:HlyD family secretion protein